MEQTLVSPHPKYVTGTHTNATLRYAELFDVVSVMHTASSGSVLLRGCTPIFLC